MRRRILHAICALRVSRAAIGDFDVSRDNASERTALNTHGCTSEYCVAPFHRGGKQNKNNALRSIQSEFIYTGVGWQRGNS